MSATTAHQPPAIPPRPSRSQEKANMPLIPPRPINRHLERSVSPNPSRFAPSPLNESPLGNGNGNGNGHNGNHSDRAIPLDLPSVGEEGMEYAGLADELNTSAREQASSPEQLRTVGNDVKLHAPKPSLPASSAKQRVMAVTRTDSDRAASFGIGRPSSVEDSAPALPSNRSLKKKASTASQLSTTDYTDDEQGIPEIGQQVPMYPNAGDVQAPSPAPGSAAAEGIKTKHHSRKLSARGGALPPGSYGLHGHGVVAQDKLEKAYFEKHPDLLMKEHTPHHHDRPYDFSMSRDDLNKIVRDTASRGSGLAVKDYAGTPSDQVGWQVIESASHKESRRASETGNVIHVDEPNRRKSVMFSEGESSEVDEEGRQYSAPILAEDELAKDPGPYDHQPAVEPTERRGSGYEIQESTSRPTSRPASLYKESPFEVRSTPLEDVEEYEPLFAEDEKEKTKKPEVEEKKSKKQRFPSADIWEDAPSSVHYTAEVSTPDLYDEQEKPKEQIAPPPRDGETPAQAFARHQEELAEKETREHGPEAFLPMRGKQKPIWVQHQAHLATETAGRPLLGQRFPSRDVWEDTPDSLKLETTVSTPQQDNEQSPVESKSPVESRSPVESKPEIPVRPQPKSPEGSEKPAIPERPKASGDESKPAIPARPKPHIPNRPAKAGPTSGGLEPAEAAAPPRAKPAVPVRPVGSKIAALQAGFMSDLNNRLRLGPQAPKKEEPAPVEEPVEEKEKAPLSDARKGRARGPQRRAPVASVSPAPAAALKADEPFKLVIASAHTLFEVDPDEGVLSVGDKSALGLDRAKDEEAKGEAQKPDISSSAPVPTGAGDEEQEYDDENKTAESQTEELGAPPAAEEESKTLATNMAGESVVEEKVKADEKHLDEVGPTYAEEH
ncbi:altered inheritance of mitochondria protein 21 [Lasiosphaeria ovina]|uniref:Altered inheritance of mitochondria protein 21 n=1 Tax=Lasiosphaeria ovina TaxID=92902 RepID=A0AAE0TYL1_9PEZI|nr:altered inheritance of mitochondria protein 21 [Lasiosphaeria ovina]